jgi:tetratricopeptide (TPR) repeat protein
MGRYLLALAILGLAAATAQAQVVSCVFHPPGSYGPFDYSDAIAQRDNLPIVEAYHFTSQVESLASGKSGYVGADISYTLNAFPNHYRALDAMSRLGLKEHTLRPRGSRCTVEGWFQRAVEYKPNDAMVHMAFGMHFYRHNMFDKAIEQLKEAARIDPKNANVQYNLGLIYFDQQKYGEAKASAIKAYANHFPLDGLRNKLIKAGQWDGKLPASAEAKSQPASQPAN